MFKFSNWSLLKKSLVALNLICFLLLSGSGLLTVFFFKTQGKFSLDQKITSIIEYVKHANSMAVKNSEVALLKSFSEQLIKDSDIQGVEFLDKDKKTIASSEKIASKDFSSIERTLFNPENKEEVIGYTKFYYNYESVDSHLKTIVISVLAIAALFQVLISLSMYFFLGRSSRRLELSVEMLKETADQARSSGSTLKDLSAELSKKGSTQAAAVELTSSTLHELSAILAKTVESSEQAFKVASNSYDFATKGQTENQSLQIAMAEISDGASKIQEITSVVEDIAFQTNILALNAAVEAARAGEQGKGFAVVADAVRTLAQKSTAAAKDINSLIIESTARVEKGQLLVKSNLKIFEGILKSAQDVKSINEELLQNAQEQSDGINQITKTMLEIDQVVTASSQSTIETANHAETMVQQSEFLHEVVYNFEKEIKGTKAA